MSMAMSQAPEERIALRNIRWETYESLLVDLAEASAPRLTYDRETLEIMSPFAGHEEPNHLLARLVEVVAEERDLDLGNLGCATFRREDLRCGFDPDSCFYIQNVDRVHGEAHIDLAVDPPPDLVIEININCPSLPKLPIYARIGVPEVWRYDGQALAIYTLTDDAYQEASGSIALPGLDRATLLAFLESGMSLRRPEWLRKVRDWARSLPPLQPLSP
jgi:Uma2 family endonuclease